MPLAVTSLLASTRPLLAAIVLFLALDLTVLVTNLWITRQVARDAVAINLAGRQRMLSQQTTKALLLATSPSRPDHAQLAQAEFQDAFGLFKQTLTAFAEGGESLGGDGQRVALQAVEGEGAEVVSAARRLIEPLSRLQAERPGSPAELQWAADFLVHNNREILALMNRLTTTLEQESVRRTRVLRIIQSTAFLLALGNFLLIVHGLIRQYHGVEEDRRRWRQLARHDSLTGLANRKAFFEQSSAILQRARGDGNNGALLMLDLDGFKAINDRFGHAAGDRILISVARRLESTARATDVVARLGGDEFAILCPQLHGERAIAQLCERLVTVIADIPDADFPASRLGVSIGAAVYPDEGYALEQLASLADRAMYAAKRAGGNRWHIA